jgi:hypothetical protein
MNRRSLPFTAECSKVLLRQKDLKFDYETPHGKPNLETGEMEDRIRTDIRYLFPIQDSDNSHEIIFEFKILKNTNDSRKAYYQKNGMHRFISGDYSKKWDFAYMVGILTNDGRTAVKELKKVLQRNDLANGTLHIRRSEKTNLLIREPSEYMPDLAEFDTEHSRTLYGNLADLLLYHFSWTRLGRLKSKYTTVNCRIPLRFEAFI